MADINAEELRDLGWWSPEEVKEKTTAAEEWQEQLKLTIAFYQDEAASLARQLDELKAADRAVLDQNAWAKRATHMGHDLQWWVALVNTAGKRTKEIEKRLKEVTAERDAARDKLREIMGILEDR